MLNVQIVTPEKALPELEADHVTAPALDGEVGVRGGHAPLVAALKPGAVMVRRAGREEEWWAVAGGVMQVHQDRVRLFVERATAAASLDLSRVRERVATLQGGASGDTELAWAQAQLAAGERSARRPA